MASSNPKQPQPDDSPWDRESAEALTRAYEQSEAEWRESRSARRPPVDRGQGAGADADAGTVDASAVEQRLAEIAGRLQQSIASIDPNVSSAALIDRIDDLEHRLAAAFEDVAQRMDGQGLKGVEAQIGGLTAHLEHTRSQLSRLDAIDERLRDLALRFDDYQRLPPASRLTDSAIEALIESAADRAATRAVQSLPPAAAGIDPQRIDALETLLQEQIAERRSAEEMTTGVLRTIEEALGRILDKVDGLEPGGFASMLPRGDEPTASAPGASMIDPLIEAYARGARALGQSAPASLLDAADYTSNTRAVVPGPDAFATPGWDDLAVEDEPARPLPRAFTAPSEPESQPADKVHDEGARGAASSTQARIKPFAATSGWRSGLLLSLVLAMLFGAGYLTVSIFLTQSHTPGPADVAAAPRSQASTERVRIVPIAASSREAMALQEAALAPHDGARPGERAEELPEAIGAASLRQAAVNGDLLAQFEVASRFADGRGVAQNDAQAFVWFQRAATHGFVPAQFRLAGLFERGAGVTADAERAKVWYRRAAEQGHVKAMHNLAVLSARKDADRADFVLAAKWFQEAADRGLTDSQYNLALLYQKGLGVEKNLFQAYKWFALAARGGDKEAAGRLEQIKSQLAPGDLIAAEQVLSVWQVRASEADAGIKAATPVGGDDVGG